MKKDVCGTISIEALKNTTEISELCHSVCESIFVTKNDNDDLVIMSMETFESFYMNKIYHELEIAEKQIDNGDVLDAFESLDLLR